MLIGDFNARSSNLKDFVNVKNCVIEGAGLPGEMGDLVYDEEKLLASGIQPYRANQDTKSDNNGHKLVDLCQNTGLLIVNGRMGNDQNLEGTTCKGVSTVSTINYIIGSPAIFPYFTNMLIDTFDPLLSDVHNPVCLEMAKVNIGPGSEVTTTKNIPQADSSHNKTNKANNSPTYKPTWEGDKMISFKNAFQLQEILKITKTNYRQV